MRLLFILFITLTVALAAADSIPQAGIKAEMEKRWDDAVDIYVKILEEAPQRSDLYVRISDIHASQKRYEQAAEALNMAIKIEPEKAQLYKKLSEAYALLEKPDKAVEAINYAIELDPKNLKYRMAHAKLSNWDKKPHDAIRSLKEILKIDPHHKEARELLARSFQWSGLVEESLSYYTDYLQKHPDDKLARLELARAFVWANRLDEAAEHYKIYNEENPDSKDGYIEYARTESWRGGYATSLNTLQLYKERFGEDQEYLDIKAGILTWSNRSTRAFEIIEPKLNKEPKNYTYNFMNTAALYKHREPVKSLESLERTEAISPDSNDNLFLRKIVTTDLRTSVRAGGKYYVDSDNISMLSAEVEGRHYLTPLTSIYALYHTDYVNLSGNYPLSFAQDDGSKSATHNSLRVGTDHRVSSKLMAKLSAGTAKSEKHTDPVYGAGLVYTPLDELMIDLNYDHHYFIITPKTMGRGTMEDTLRMSLYYEPSHSMYINFSTAYATLSDSYTDNERWSVELSPKWVVLRKQHLNFDIGISASLYGYDKESKFYDLGYYAPELYQAYYLISFTSWKFSDDDSINLALSAGTFKDNNMHLFKLGGGASVEGVFGLYRDWMLKVALSTTYSARYYDQAYSAYSGSLYITKRF